MVVHLGVFSDSLTLPSSLSLHAQFRRFVAIADAQGSQYTKPSAAQSIQQQRFSGFGHFHTINLELEQLSEPDTSPLKAQASDAPTP